jgi:thiol-disulfide isomerase/thioredoxin
MSDHDRLIADPAAPRRRHALGGLLALALGPAIPPARAATVRDWPAGKSAPVLDLPQLDGGRWTLAAQRGHPVLLNFWASWCGPCRDEMPSLELMAQRHLADGLRVVAVNYQEGERTVRRFLEQVPMDLPILMDQDGRATQAWTSKVFPTSVLVGRDGRPQRVVLGEVDWGGAEARAWMSALVRRVDRT